MIEIKYFTSSGGSGSVRAETLEAAILKYIQKRKVGAGWGHYFVNGERHWV